MVGVVEPQDTRARALSGHVLGAAGGLALGVVVMGLVTREQDLRDRMVQDPGPGYAWGIVGLFALAGVLVGLAAMLAGRTPWLPTVASVVLLYYLLASMPTASGTVLPLPLFPRAQWSLTALGALVGVLSATAVWAWWSYRRRSSRP